MDSVWSCPDCGTNLRDWWCPVCERLWSPQSVADWDDPPDDYDPVPMSMWEDT